MKKDIVSIDFAKLISEGPVKVSGDEYRVECPVCKELGHSYKKMKLFIKKDLSVGYCFRCGTTFKNKINVLSLPKDYIFQLGKRAQPKKYGEEVINTSYYNDSWADSEIGLSYLKSRNAPWLIENKDKLRFKFRGDRVVIPFFKSEDEDDVIFYQCRFYNPEKSGKRYFLPPSKQKPLYVSPLGNKSSNTVILCEGPFGAMAISSKYPQYRTFAVMGSYVTDYQAYLLKDKGIENFVLYFDEDKLNDKNFCVLSEKFPFANFIKVHSQYGDPEDDLKNNCLGVIDLDQNNSSGLSWSVSKFVEDQVVKNNSNARRQQFPKSFSW